MRTGKIIIGMTVAAACWSFPAAAQNVRFAEDVYPVLRKAGCHDCHNANGVASATRLQFPEAEANANDIERFGATLIVLVDTSAPDKSLLLNKPTNKVTHTGGKRIAPGSAEETILRSWVERLAKSPAASANRSPGTRAARPESGTLRRLTHNQYNNTVRDLLGDSTNPSRQFPPEDFVNGFKNQYQAQSISPLQQEAYGIAAEKLAADAFLGGDHRGLVPCKTRDAACGTRFITEFGLKAFRRPLTAQEVQRYTKLLAQSGDFLRGCQTIVEAMLQSPSFLFWMDSVDKPEWQPYARASKLSYFLWDSMPDAALLKKAASGALNTPAGFEKTAREMLDSPKAKQGVNEFISQWLRFDTVVNLVKDRRAFPQFSRDLAMAMTEETSLLLADLIWSDRNFMEMFTADYSFVNGDLATMYQLPAPAEDFAKVVYPAGSERAGILGQGSFLALTSKPGETSPTARGLFVREHFLCQNVPPPPPGVNTNLPPVTEKPMSLRERLGVHLSNDACASCHNLIDPIGFGFEKFDGIGRQREKGRAEVPTYNRRVEARTVEVALDTAGWIAGIQDSQFNSPRQLGSILAKNPKCQECVVKQLFRYAMGRSEIVADRPVLDRVTEGFRSSQFRFKELMILLVRHTAFPPEDASRKASSGNAAGGS